MKVHIRYFGMLAEALGIQEEWIDADAIPSSGDLSVFFNQRHDKLAAYHYSIAVNQEVCKTLPVDEPIHEIALLPPFAGG